MTGPGSNRRRDGVVAVLLAVAALVASLPWLRVYSSPGARWSVVCAAPAAVLLSACLSRALRVRAIIAFATSGGLLLLALFFTSGHDLHSLASGLLHGPSRLFSETLPLGGDAVGTPAMVVVWLAGAVAGETAFRSGAGSELPGIAFAAPIASFVLSIAVAARAPGGNRIAAPLLLVLIAVAAAARRGGEMRVARTHRAVILFALAAAILAVGIPAIPGFERAPAAVYEPPVTESHLLVDPVAAFGAFRDAGGHRGAIPVMKVTTGAPSDGYLTAAVLDDFDGSEWTFESTFKPTGGRVPVPPGYSRPAVGTSAVTTSTTLLSVLPVPLLPVLERAEIVDGLPVAADARNGMLVPDQRFALPGRFRATSDAPVVTLTGVPAADGIESASSPTAGIGATPLSADLQLPADSSVAVGTAARFLSDITGIRPAPTVAFLQRAVEALRHFDRRLDPNLGPAGGNGASGGTSLAQVINAVTIDRSATPEQFATFLAIVARYLGVPARLATGFRLKSEGPAVLPAGSYTATNRDAWSWVELPVSGMGWVAADPTPTAVTGLDAPPPEPVQATPTTLAAPTANAVPRNQAGGHAVASPVTIRRNVRRGTDAWGIVLAVSSGVLAMFLAGTAGAVLARRRRRRKRFSEDPALLASGAWLELLDTLTRAGMDIPDGCTSSEIATESGRFFGADMPDRVGRVGSTADRAICSVLDPPDLNAALAAWQTQRELSRDVYRCLDRRQRARMLLASGSRRGRR